MAIKKPNATKSKEQVKIDKPEANRTIKDFVELGQKPVYKNLALTYAVAVVSIAAYTYATYTLAPSILQPALYFIGAAGSIGAVMWRTKKTSDSSHQPLIDVTSYAVGEADSKAMHVTDNQSVHKLYNIRKMESDPEEPDAGSKLIEDYLARSGTYIITANAKGEILSTNSTFENWQPGNSIFKLRLLYEIEEDNLQGWVKKVKRSSLTARNSWQRVRTNPESDEDRHIYDLNASYSRSNETEIVLVFQDKTERYQADEKDLDFIAFAAHELRGPITVIRGYLEVLSDELDDTLTEMQKTVLGRVEVSANRLTGYVNNILNVSRYDRRHLRVDLSEQKIHDIYNSIKEDMSSRARVQQRSLVVNIPEDLPTVAADPYSIAEVFTNLVDNALKYTSESGLVVITAEANASEVQVHVQDNGIGMPEPVVKNLFRKFYRSHRSRESVAGTGIGLYLCKAILESHGGSISVRSSLDKGSTFTFTLPLYDIVKKNLTTSHDGSNNEQLINKNKTWISNHNMYRG